MRYAALILLLFLWALPAAPARAQQAAEPLVEVEFETQEAIPGQPLSLRMTVLVPTWLTSPVIFPSYEWPNVMVRLPDRATTPVSRRVGGDTWSGVSRHFRLIPMIPGRFDIPTQDVVVNWADPDTNQPRQDRVQAPAITFSGVAPPGAEGLDPFIAARDLQLSQEISGATVPLAPGDSVTRVVTAKVTGLSPMFLPQLLPQDDITGIALYPAEPVLTETGQRGEMAGTRVETTTYIAQSGGAGTAAAVTLEWYNLDSGQVETASTDPVDLAVDAPAARTAPDLRTIAMLALLALLCLAALWAILKRLWPRWKHLWQVRRARVLASEKWAFGALRKTVRARDYPALLPALDLWAHRLHGPGPQTDPAIAAALSRLGAARYGDDAAPAGNAWADLDAALLRHRAQARAIQAKTASTLPPLNPATPYGSGSTS